MPGVSRMEIGLSTMAAVKSLWPQFSNAPRKTAALPEIEIPWKEVLS